MGAVLHVLFVVLVYGLVGWVVGSLSLMAGLPRWAAIVLAFLAGFVLSASVVGLRL